MSGVLYLFIYLLYLKIVLHLDLPHVSSPTLLAEFWQTKVNILFFLYGEDTENLQLKTGFFVHKKIVSAIMIICSTEEGLGCHTQCFIVADVLFRMHMRQL